MNNYIYNFSDNFHNFEFGVCGDFNKDFNEGCFKASDMLFNFQDPAFGFPTAGKFEEEFENYVFCFEKDKDSIEFNNAKNCKFESINQSNESKVNESIPISNTMSTGKSKDTQKRTTSGSYLTLSLSQKDEVCYDEIDSVSEKLSKAKSGCESSKEDLNLVVEKLLNATPVDYLKDQGIELDDKTMQLLSVNKRKRKTKNQIELLAAEYSRDSEWTKPFMQQLARKLGMSASSIYKWHWDQKHKSLYELPEESNKAPK